MAKVQPTWSGFLPTLPAGVAQVRAWFYKVDQIGSAKKLAKYYGGQDARSRWLEADGRCATQLIRLMSVLSVIGMMSKASIYRS